MTLFLNDQDIDQLINMEMMLKVIEEMQCYHGNGKAYNLPRHVIMNNNRELATMGGGLFYKDVFGVKTYTIVDGNYAFHVSLYDSVSGELIAFLQANRLGQLRTGATTGLAVKYIAPLSASTVGILGSGFQARTQLEAITYVRNINHAQVYSPNIEHRTAFAQFMTDLLGLPVTPVSSNQALVLDNQITVCIATNTDPIVLGEWLEPGATIIGAGPANWRYPELDETGITKINKIYVDSLEQAKYEAGDLSLAVNKGIIQWNQVGELRHLVSGESIARQSKTDIIYAKLMGTGVADVAAAMLAYESAKETGVGTVIDF